MSPRICENCGIAWWQNCICTDEHEAQRARDEEREQATAPYAHERECKCEPRVEQPGNEHHTPECNRHHADSFRALWRQTRHAFYGGQG